MKKSPSSSSLSSSSTSSQCSIGSNSKTHQLLQIPKITTKTKRITTKKNVTTSPVKRSSIFRGVTRHRWTGRFEAHLWDKHTWSLNQKKKGRQVYLGAYDCEEAAARTYDLAALKYWGPDTILNFSIDAYEKELEEMEKMTREEYLASLRRKSSGFSRGVSKYRGVARHHHNGRWEARIGRVHGNKYMYLGTYNTQEEAAAAYDKAAIQYRGANAVTNFNISSYGDVPVTKEEPISTDQQLNNLIIIKQEVEQQQEQQRKEEHLPSSTMTNSIFDEHDMGDWGMSVDMGFDPYTVPDIDIPFETTQPGELPDLVYDIGFEDNIGDFIFENEVNLNQSFGSYGGLGGEMLKRQPSSSTTTSSMDFV